MYIHLIHLTHLHNVYTCVYNTFIRDLLEIYHDRRQQSFNCLLKQILFFRVVICVFIIREVIYLFIMKHILYSLFIGYLTCCIEIKIFLKNLLNLDSMHDWKQQIWKCWDFSTVITNLFIVWFIFLNCVMI